MEANSTTTDELSNVLLFPSACILLFLVFIGLYGNASIIMTTLKFKNFHHPCGILIAMLAAGDFGHQISHFPYGILLFSGMTVISQRLCFWIQFVPALCMMHSVAILVFLGVDRLICMTLPILYREISAHKRLQFCYLLLLNAIPILYTVTLTIISYRGMMADPNKETLCLVVAFFVGKAEQLWALSAIIFTASAVVIYIIIWITVWLKVAVIASIKSTLKPLTVILFVTFCGWFLGISMVTYISEREDLPKNLRIELISYAGIFINFSISSNYFVYRLFGSDYKKAFKRLWKPDALPIVSTTKM